MSEILTGQRQWCDLIKPGCWANPCSEKENKNCQVVVFNGEKSKPALSEFKRPIIIAGPCGAESQKVVQESTQQALERGLSILRASLWKPRTEPGYDGVKGKGISWLVEVAEKGLTPATEVLNAKQADRVIDAVIKNTSTAKVILWLGSRNQNHQVQKAVGRSINNGLAEVIRGEPRVLLMIKNQPWKDEKHWKGIVKHVLSGGAKKEQLILCHRGFSPGINGYRNRPDFDMAMKLKNDEELESIPMIIDPSHIGGSQEKVLFIAKKAMEYEKDGKRFDGLVIEVHPKPEEAKSDAKQQLAWNQFDELMESLPSNQ